MNMYKFIDERHIEKYKGGFVILNNMIHTNPTEEILRQVGYKPLEHAEEPEYDLDTQYVDITYTEEDDYIQEVKTVIDIVIDEVTEGGEEA